MTTILIVDDRRDARLELETRLCKRGFTVVTAEDGNQAIEMCSLGGIDAVIMDINMPELDGCDATERLKSDENTQSIPIILYTALVATDQRVRAEACGGDAFIEKPIHIKTLIALLGKVLHADYEAHCLSEDDDASPTESPGVDQAPTIGLDVSVPVSTS